MQSTLLNPTAPGLLIRFSMVSNTNPESCFHGPKFFVLGKREECLEEEIVFRRFFCFVFSKLFRLLFYVGKVSVDQR